jgi:uncharacterized protein with von Willebrand factor type A (vWA) domain
MRTFIYSQWDGRQALYSLEADRALDALAELLSLEEGLSPQDALDWMRQAGFELAGLDFRVMGLAELISELRQQARDMLSQVHMDHAFDERLAALRDLLDREQTAVQREHGVESERFGDLMRRREPLPRRLSEALERFRDYPFTDPDAEKDYQRLLEDLEQTRALEQFAERNRRMLSGQRSLSYEEAAELMEQIQSLSQMVQALMEGRFESLSIDELRERLGDDAAQSILILRDLQGSLERAGYLREGANGLELTPRAIRKLGELALDNIYGQMARGGHGGHETRHDGVGVLTTERTRRYEFGRPAHIDALGTLRNALTRGGDAQRKARGVPPARARAAASSARAKSPGTRSSRPARADGQGASRGDAPAPHARASASLSIGRLDLVPDDLEVYDTDLLTETTTVLLLDMSYSMSHDGRWPAAKRVALAMDQLIRTQYPRDRFFIVGFYTRARQLTLRELPELAINFGDPFTNLQEALMLAERLIDRHPNPNKQIIVITDGQPTAYFMDGELHVELPQGRGGVSPNANRATLAEVRAATKREITINTFMLHSSPELLSFVEAMTRINRGRAFYTTPDRIGEYVMVDYLDRKRRRVR